ncbi:helix-turn-helix domain-containing protein [Paenibacillus sp. FSL L8-0470]|uniref:AraC family transcriptional regulator n=1 Tax=Paenibacillus sp. FSL L8-0470 TaxID=2954688 RepID=UPI0030FAC948
MNNYQLIVQALDHIEAELKSPLSVTALSRRTGYSLYHFIRLFQAITGITPGDYIARRKITEAAKDLKRWPERSFQDIALDYHFNDYETFTRAFKRLLHTTPTQVRNKRNNPLLPLLHRLHEQDLLHLPVVQGTPPQIVKLDEITLKGPIVNVIADYSVISEAWSQLFTRVPSLHGRRLPERYYQVGYWADDFENSGASYICACELYPQPEISGRHQYAVTQTAYRHSASEQAQLSADFPVYTLPAATYLKFIHKGLSKDVSYTYKYIYETWLPKSEYRLSLPYEFEYYGEQYLGPDDKDSISEIYVPLELL